MGGGQYVTGYKKLLYKTKVLQYQYYKKKRARTKGQGNLFKGVKFTKKTVGKVADKAKQMISNAYAFFAKRRKK